MRRPMMWAPSLVAALACVGPSGPRAPSFPPPRSTAEAEARLRFLEQRLASNRRHAQLWHWGWTGINAATAAAGAVGAARTDDGDERAQDVVEAVQSAIGLADLWLLRPIPGRSAAWTAGAGDPSARLAAGERELLAVSQRAQDRFDWRPHAADLVLQLLGAGVLLGLGDAHRAGVLLGTGVLSGEAYVWSEPWGGERDLEAYRAFVAGPGVPRPPATTFEIVPTAAGVACRLAW